ncbi:hypothetical protein [Amycolatopsis sp. cmx-4-61]|uniref:hypothetical protein n=1 Tax=Amycolatopsis sp. cmx-4-61 TaxID=2790937 RepID=UPI00397B2DA9
MGNDQQLDSSSEPSPAEVLAKQYYRPRARLARGARFAAGLAAAALPVLGFLVGLVLIYRGNAVVGFALSAAGLAASFGLARWWYGPATRRWHRG